MDGRFIYSHPRAARQPLLLLFTIIRVRSRGVRAVGSLMRLLLLSLIILLLVMLLRCVAVWDGTWVKMRSIRHIHGGNRVKWSIFCSVSARSLIWWATLIARVMLDVAEERLMGNIYSLSSLLLRHLIVDGVVHTVSCMLLTAKFSFESHHSNLHVLMPRMHILQLLMQLLVVD